MGRLFAKSTGENIDFGAVSSYSFIQNTLVFTISAWIKLTDHTSADSETILGNTDTTGEKGFMALWRNNLGYTKRIDIQVFKGTAGTIIASANSANNAIADNNWHHVLIKNNTGGTPTILIDGASSSATPIESAGTGATSTGDSTRTLKIGRDGASAASPFGGKIAEVAIWDVALSDAECSTLAKGVSANRIRRNSLKAYLPLWGASSPEPDLSGQRNNGTITGTVSATSHAPISRYVARRKYSNLTPLSLTTVNQSLIAKYDIIQFVNQSLQAKYDILAFVSQTLQAKYDMGGIVAQTLSALWDMTGIASQTLKANYDLIQFVNQTFTGKYDLRQLVAQTLQAKYDIIALVSAILTALYDSGGRVSQTFTGKYDLIQFVFGTFRFNYDLSQLVAQTSQAKYDILALVAQQLKANYDVSQLVAGDLAVVYDLRELVARMLQADYKLMQLATETLQAPYHLLGGIAQTLSVPYDILQVTGESAIIAPYNIRNSASNTFAGIYNIFQLVGETSQMLYDLRALASNEFLAKYDISQAQSAELKTLYSIGRPQGSKTVMPKDFSKTIIQKQPRKTLP